MKALTPEQARLFVAKRIEARDEMLAEIREAMARWAEAGVPLGPFEHGDFFAQMRFEINSVESRVFPAGLAAARRSRKKISRARRKRIYVRDDYTCRKCGHRFDPREVWSAAYRDEDGQQRLPRRGITIDHIIPEAEGGATTDDNLQTLCGVCNGLKGKTIPDD